MFLKSRNSLAPKTDTRPIVQKKLSITDALTPAEMIRVGARTSFGIEGYEISPSKKRPEQYSVGKSKALGPIALEANFRKNYPGAGAYSTGFE
jgi:hypothetical protein